MANSRSARKRIRQTERKHVRNRTIRSAVRTKVAKARRSLLDVADEVNPQEDVQAAITFGFLLAGISLVGIVVAVILRLTTHAIVGQASTLILGPVGGTCDGDVPGQGTEK